MGHGENLAIETTMSAQEKHRFGEFDVPMEALQYHRGKVLAMFRLNEVLVYSARPNWGNRAVRYEAWSDRFDELEIGASKLYFVRPIYEEFDQPNGLIQHMLVSFELGQTAGIGKERDE